MHSQLLTRQVVICFQGIAVGELDAFGGFIHLQSPAAIPPTFHMDVGSDGSVPKPEHDAGGLGSINLVTSDINLHGQGWEIATCHKAIAATDTHMACRDAVHWTR